METVAEHIGIKTTSVIPAEYLELRKKAGLAEGIGYVILSDKAILS